MRRCLTATRVGSAVLALGLAGCTLHGTAPDRVVKPELQQLDTAAPWSPLRVFDEAAYRIWAEYVVPVEPATLFANGLRGLLRLGLSPDQQATVQAGLRALPALAGFADQQRSAHATIVAVGSQSARPDDLTPLTDAAIQGMADGLDPHSGFQSAAAYRASLIAGRTPGLSMGLRLVNLIGGESRIVEVLDGSPARAAGVRPGDVLTSVDGATPASFPSGALETAMREPAGSPAALTIAHPGERGARRVEVPRGRVPLPSVVPWTVIGDVAYIRLSTLTAAARYGLRTGLAAARRQATGPLAGLVLDLRDNPGGVLDATVGITDDLLDSGGILATVARRTADFRRWEATPGDITGGLPIVVLVNAGTAAGSEILAGALQENRRAIVLGSPTSGDGVIQTVMPFGVGLGNGAIRLTTSRVQLPSGRSLQRNGIEPDIVTDRSEDALSSARRTRRESDQPRSLPATEGSGRALAPRPDLAALQAAAASVPVRARPFDPADPASDQQIQQAVAILHRPN